MGTLNINQIPSLWGNTPCFDHGNMDPMTFPFQNALSCTPSESRWAWTGPNMLPPKPERTEYFSAQKNVEVEMLENYDQILPKGLRVTMGYKKMVPMCFNCWFWFLAVTSDRPRKTERMLCVIMSDPEYPVMFKWYRQPPWPSCWEIHSLLRASFSSNPVSNYPEQKSHEIDRNRPRRPRIGIEPTNFRHLVRRKPPLKMSIFASSVAWLSVAKDFTAASCTSWSTSWHEPGGERYKMILAGTHHMICIPSS